jgi:hypothetical protein
MSDFNLDVDSPYEVPLREVLEARPEPLPYPQNYPKYRFYGNNIKTMIDVANTWEEGEMKEALTYTIANHMKKCFLNWNKDTVDDKVIFDHLVELSDGKIDLRDSEESLIDATSLMRSKKRPTSNKKPTNKKTHNNRGRKRY